MNRKAIALTLILSLLVSTLAGTLLIQNGARTLVAQGQTSNNTTVVDGSPASSISIQSPENKTYNDKNITLHFTIATDIPSEPKVAQQFYVAGADLDFNTYSLVDIFNGLTYGYPSTPISLPISFTNQGGTANLTDLSQGPHQLTVWLVVFQYMISYDGYEGSVYSTVSFNIDSIPPNITVLSPQTKTYNSSVVPLDFTVNKKVSQISYSLDGTQNITAAGNVTLTQLSDGEHNLTIYAADEAGNIGSSKTVNFTVALPQLKHSEPFPTAAVAVTIAVVVVLTAGLLVSFKKSSIENKSCPKKADLKT